MWVIINEKSEILAYSKKRIVDSRAFQITDEDFANHVIAENIVWVMRNADGSIEQACDHYPLHPDAQPINRNDREFVDYVAAYKTLQETRAKRRDAWRRIQERLIDEELAKSDQSR